MITWNDLRDELDRWRDREQPATFWWRDDDAAAPTAALDRLLALSVRYSAGLALAVIPGSCENGLAAVLSEAEASYPGARDSVSRNRPEIAVLQHGIAHENRAPAGEKKVELGPSPRPEDLARGLTVGRERLSSLFESRFLPVLVPPWNRIAPELLPTLPALGFTGISTYQARSARFPVPGLLQVNTHADLLRWKPERRFLGEGDVLSLLVAHLRDQRSALERAGPEPCDREHAPEPTGILTHHLVHDTAAWDFLERLLDLLSHHPAARVLAPSTAFSHSAP